MAFTSAEEKLRYLAAQYPALQARLGTHISTFRWYDRVLVQKVVGEIAGGQEAVRVTRVSTLRGMNQGGIMNLSAPRLQIDALSKNSEDARSLANDIITFLGTISLCTDSEFSSPVTAPNQNPQFLLNQSAGILQQPQPPHGPVYYERMDIRLYNREDLSPLHA
jgi:hypothetical protein